MTSTRLARTSISLLTCNVSINLVNTKGKNFSDLDMQAATSSNSLVYLRSCLFPFLLMVSPIYRCTRKIRYTSNCRLRERRWVDSRTFSFFFMLYHACVQQRKLIYHRVFFLLLYIKIMIESHNDVDINMPQAFLSMRRERC